MSFPTLSAAIKARIAGKTPRVLYSVIETPAVGYYATSHQVAAPRSGPYTVLILALAAPRTGSWLPRYLHM